MNKLTTLLLVSILCFVSGFCQNAFYTKDGNMAALKSDITALKIVLAVYGDSITNKMLMGETPLPGVICIEFKKNRIDKIVFYEIYDKWTETLKQKFREEIMKQNFFISAIPYMTDRFRKYCEEKGVSTYPFSPHFYYPVLHGKKIYFLNKQNPKDYQFVDYVKELIKEYDQIEIMDMDGIYHK